MATVRVAPEYHPKIEDILNALGFQCRTDRCNVCGKRLIIEVVLDGEDFSPTQDQYLCPPDWDLLHDK